MQWLLLPVLWMWLAGGASSQSTALTEVPQIRFTDVTKTSGITFEHAVSPEKKYLYESMSGGVLLLDYDQDGWLDIYFTNSRSVAMTLAGQEANGALYHNNHDGTFTDVTEKVGLRSPCSAMGGAVGDYNNDGWPDIVLTCQEGLVLLRNNGNGTFTNVTRQAHLTDPQWATGAAFGDYDGDGFVDLVVTRYVDFDIKNPPPYGVGATCHYRGIPVQCGPRGMKGLPDSLYHNNGDGTFTDVSAVTGVNDSARYFGLGAIWSDFDDDGHPDLFIADDSTPNYLYRNDGKGHFADVSFVSGTAVTGEGSETAGMGIAACDYNHTGRFSLFVTTFEDQVATLYRNDGAMNFTDASFASGLAAPTIKFLKWGIGCEDFDNDGWPDIFIVDGHVYPQVDSLSAGAKYQERKIILRNTGKGSFQDVTEQGGPAVMLPEASRGAAFGDLNNDGRIDVVIENIDGKPMILRNTGGDKNHWVTLRLTGKRSNRLAIGAKVKVTAGGMQQVSEVRSGGSYLSQNDLRIHFGLGNAAKVEKVEVHWPSGNTDTFKDLGADGFYQLVEGESTAKIDR
ncbi:MAG TPA: CRTAC1 family protein [Candidatus Sulfotelmatobacter sp.]